MPEMALVPPTEFNLSIISIEHIYKIFLKHKEKEINLILERGTNHTWFQRIIMQELEKR